VFLVTALGCVGVCLWRSNHGERGFEVVPGYSLVYELDDRYFGSQLTESCRRWSPVNATGDAPAAPVQASNSGVADSSGSSANFPMKETTSFRGAGPSYDGGSMQANPSALYGEGAAPAGQPTGGHVQTGDFRPTSAEDSL
jgi:hypothetical protein